MSPSADGQKPAGQHRVYIVERRSEFRELNSQIDPNADQQPYEPEISYLDFAYQDEKQAYSIAVREQILELDENGTHNGRKVAAQTNLSLKERLKSIHKEIDVAADSHEDSVAPVVKYEVLEFPLAPLKQFNETDFLKELDNVSESEDIDDEEEEDLADEEEGDEEEVDEEVDEGEEGVEEVEGEEEEDDEQGEDDLEESEDEGEEVDDDDEDDDSDAAPQTKKQRK